jgi:hypothetical protein
MSCTGSLEARGCGGSEALAVAAHALGCGHRFVAESWSTSAYFRNGDFRNGIYFRNDIYFRNRFCNLRFPNVSRGFVGNGFCGCELGFPHSAQIIVSAHFGGLVPL